MSALLVDNAKMLVPVLQLLSQAVEQIDETSHPRAAYAIGLVSLMFWLVVYSPQVPYLPLLLYFLTRRADTRQFVRAVVPLLCHQIRRGSQSRVFGHLARGRCHQPWRKHRARFTADQYVSKSCIHLARKKKRRAVTLEGSSRWSAGSAG